MRKIKLVKNMNNLHTLINVIKDLLDVGSPMKVRQVDIDYDEKKMDQISYLAFIASDLWEENGTSIIEKLSTKMGSSSPDPIAKSLSRRDLEYLQQLSKNPLTYSTPYLNALKNNLS